MTGAQCVSFCAQHGYHFAGTEYSDECCRQFFCAGILDCNADNFRLRQLFAKFWRTRKRSVNMQYGMQWYDSCNTLGTLDHLLT